MPFKDEEDSQPQRPRYESGLPLKTLAAHDKIFESFPKNPGGLGFSEKANGLMLCTEYLGFESSDMKMSDNEVENKMTFHAEVDTERVVTKRRKTKENMVAPVQERKREFPPPLSSLNSRGQRSFYLRPVRKDGRLELTQVMIDRPEIFRASREDGRLRLHLIDGVDSPIRDYSESGEIVDFEEEPKCLDRPHLESGREINKNIDASSDQVVDSSTINDDNRARNWGYKSSYEVSWNSVDHDVTNLNDEHDAREWTYKSCYKFMEKTVTYIYGASRT
ncbi:unnamed protein product [Arabis nemorensis]|uniref:FAF domain-containing protein n=1 Tax=Arabis nemorensis TaxID=586526 RepID=A0A565AZM7_9BRAS|nr:unnamed protein product [Arabis nemorensis]